MPNAGFIEERQKLSDLIERLWVHDELAAQGLTDEMEKEYESGIWCERYPDYRSLIGIAETILGAYEEVES